MPTPRYVLERGGPEGPRLVGELFDMPAHGMVCLHTEDPEIARLLEAEALFVPRRPPYLDAGRGRIHGSYRPTPQINLFFEPPIEAVAEAIGGALAGAGYALRERPGPSASANPVSRSSASPAPAPPP